MENASKALVIVGGILLAILALSLGIQLSNKYKENAEDIQKEITVQEISVFNSNFNKYVDRKDISIHEIISTITFAQEYNGIGENKREEAYMLKIYVKGVKTENTNLADGSIFKTEDIVETIKNKSNIKYKCTKIEYGEKGIINVVKFEQEL